MYRSREIGWRGFQIASSPPRSGQRQKEEESKSERTKEETHTQIAHFVGQIVIRRFIFLFLFFFILLEGKSLFFSFFLRLSLFFWHARPHRLFSKALTRHLNKRFLSFLFLVTLKLFRFYLWLLLISNSQCFRPTVALAVNSWQVLQSLKPFSIFFLNRRVRALLATVPHQECINNSAPALKYTHPFKSSRPRNTKEKKK